MSESPKYERAPGLESHEADDGLVIFDPAVDKIYHINSSAGVFFELCDGTRDAERIAEVATGVFGPDELLVREGIVRQVDGDS